MNSIDTITKIFDLEKKESKKQKNYLSLIASESLAYKEVLKISSSVLTNKYAEGYPGNRYYSGCKYIDEIETIAIEEAKRSFSCNFANVQPLSGSIANFAVYQAFLKPNDLILAMDLNAGGHLTHSSSNSFVTNIYKVITYSIDTTTEEINYKKLKEIALKEKPKLIIVGTSSYSLSVNFQRFKEIADLIGAYLFADIAHLSGLIITGQHQHCFPYCDVAMATTHKQLKGPKGAIILWNKKEYTHQINKSVFPKTQGGPFMHLIAAKAIALAKTRDPIYKQYYEQVVKNAKTMVSRFLELNVEIVSKKTETHMFVINVVKSFGITGDIAQNLLEQAHILCNKNILVGDVSYTRPSGIRLGTLIGTDLNMKKHEFLELTNIIYEILSNHKNKQIIKQSKAKVKDLLIKQGDFFVNEV